ncbi:hypothetical protein GCM10023192_88430 [Amycolatopsis samaneae]
MSRSAAGVLRVDRTPVLRFEGRGKTTPLGPEVAEVGWLLRERATGREWRLENSDMAWTEGGYDLARFELHVTAEEVVGQPDGVPDRLAE